MSTVKGVVVSPDAPARLKLADVAAPSPARSEALIRVAAISLNRGEVRRAQSAEAGTRPGWDLAGTVEQAAADGSGPPAGTRVVGFLPSGAWAEIVAVPTNSLATLPEEVTFTDAATLPVAGLTALYTLEKGGSLLQRNVLISGASGGVGYFAVQLARDAGANVVGLLRSQERAHMIQDMGITIAVGEDASAAAAHGPYNLVVDGVGGSTLASALTLLAPDGLTVVYGATGGATPTIDLARFYSGGGFQLYGFILFHELRRMPTGPEAGLARLVALLAQGKLRTYIGVEASWTEVGNVAQRLTDRDYAGKAVLHVGGA